MILGVDVWEGSLEVNEFILLDSGVKFMIPRLNDMNGGHHIDENFYRQWIEAAGFLRAPYFVYNPWVSGERNADWLFDNMPDDTPPRIFCDIEVRYPDYPAQEYAYQVAEFIAILKGNGLQPCIYTGGWFLSYLSEWPNEVDYWWARYPLYLYPEVATQISWMDIKSRIDTVGWSPDPAGVCPGAVKLWQCSADRYIPTGTLRTTDINAWNGDLASLEAWWGAKFPQSGYEPPPVTDRVRVSYTDGIYIRSAPNGTKIGGAYYGSVWDVMGRVADSLGRMWVQVGPQAFIAGWYTVGV